MIDFVSWDTTDWQVPDGVDADSAGEALRVKRIVQGSGGFFNSVVSCPPHWEIGPHHHDHAELLVVLDGACEIGGRELRPYDTAALAAGVRYGVIAGVDGVTFMTVRTGEAGTTVTR